MTLSRGTLIGLTAVTMIAFAANSLLNRGALASGHIDPGAFALIRVAAGAVTLLGLAWLRSGNRPTPKRPDVWAVTALTIYLLGFSYAYVRLDAGIGALILFGGVQATMFAGSVLGGQRIGLPRWAGMGLALAGLAILVWPTGGLALSPLHAAMMGAAALGWGIYTMIGTQARDPLIATAWNFAYAIPLALLCYLVVGVFEAPSVSGSGLAIASGAVTSGLGYALWYRLLPDLGAIPAALSQLTVPVIALVAGVLLLAEPVTTRAVLASALICGGVALGLLVGRRRPSTDVESP